MKGKNRRHRAIVTQPSRAEHAVKPLRFEMAGRKTTGAGRYKRGPCGGAPGSPLEASSARSKPDHQQAGRLTARHKILRSHTTSGIRCSNFSKTAPGTATPHAAPGNSGNRPNNSFPWRKIHRHEPDGTTHTSVRLGPSSVSFCAKLTARMESALLFFGAPHPLV